MRIFKNGYTKGFPVARVDTSNCRIQHRYFTFCFKAFAAERLPDSITAKGFNQRCIPLQCTFGRPQYDITEVMNPAGEEENEELRDKLHRLRNKLLIHRLYHFHDRLPSIKLNLTGRERQLFMPTIRVFHGTQALDKLLKVIGSYVSKRREANANSLNAFIYHVIMDIVKTRDTAELESSLIWNTITESLPGNYIQHKPLSYDSSEFGIISQKRIVEILIQVFGAKQSNNRREERRLIFDIGKLQRLGQIYDLAIDVKVGVGDMAVTDVTNVTYIGLDKHLYKPTTIVENYSHNDKVTDIPIFKSKNDEESTPVNTNKDPPTSMHSSVHPSHVSHPSQHIATNSTSTSSYSIYGISEHSDIFACHNCRLRGDRFFKEGHKCGKSK